MKMKAKYPRAFSGIYGWKHPSILDFSYFYNQQYTSHRASRDQMNNHAAYMLIV